LLDLNESGAIIVGLLAVRSELVMAGALLLAITGVITTFNLVAGPRRVRRHARDAPTAPPLHMVIGART